MKKFTQMKKSAGYSLVELIIVLAVIAVLLGGLYFAKQKLFSSVDSKQEATNYLQLIGTTQDGWSLASSYANVDTAWLIGTGQVPPEWVANGGSEIRNSYNGLVTIGPTGTGDRQLVLTSEDIPSKDCQKIVKILARESLTMGTGASNTNIKASPSDEYDPTSVQTACTASDPVTINMVAN